MKKHSKWISKQNKWNKDCPCYLIVFAEIFVRRLSNLCTLLCIGPSKFKIIYQHIDIDTGYSDDVKKWDSKLARQCFEGRPLSNSRNWIGRMSAGMQQIKGDRGERIAVPTRIQTVDSVCIIQPKISYKKHEI